MRMASKSEQLQELIGRRLKDFKAAKYCVLINCDDFSCSFLCEENDSVFLVKRVDYEKKCKTDVFGICEKIVPETLNEVNRKLYHYILSDRLMNEDLPFDFLKENDCRSYEMFLSEFRKDIEDFAQMIFQKCAEERIDAETSFVVMAGRITELYLIRYFYLSCFSYDPMLVDPRIVFYHDKCEDDLFMPKPDDAIEEIKREVTGEELKGEIGEEEKEESGKEIKDFKQTIEKNTVKEDIAVNGVEKTEVYAVILFGDGVEKKGINIYEDDMSIDGFTGPIFVAVSESLIVEINNRMKKVELPYKIDPLDCDMIEIAAFKRENKTYLRIRRCQYPTRFYDILLVNE